MKKKNLNKLGNIIKSINNTIQTCQSDKIVFCPEKTMDRWQHDLFLILCDEQKESRRMSLKCMIDKWLHKGQISQEEYDAVMKKLAGHDKQLLEDLNEFLVEEKGEYVGSGIEEFLEIRKGKTND